MENPAGYLLVEHKVAQSSVCWLRKRCHVDLRDPRFIGVSARSFEVVTS